MPFRSAQADRRPKALRGRIHPACPAPGVGLRRRKRRSSVGAGRPLAEGFHADWKSASPGAARWASAFADASDAFRSAQADRWPKASRGRIHPACPAPGVGLRRREGCLFGRRRPTVGRRLSRRLKSASPGAARRASASADASDAPRSAQADRWPEALRGRIHPACPAPGVGLRRRKGCLFGRRRPTAGRRLSRRLEIGLSGRCAPGVGLRRREECLSGRRRPTVGRRPLEAEFIRRRPTAGRRPQRVEFVRLVRCASHGFGRNTATRVPRPGALVMESCPPSISTHWRMEVRPMVLR